MAEVPVYLVSNLKIEDTGPSREYEKGFFPILKKHGGSFITSKAMHRADRETRRATPGYDPEQESEPETAPERERKT